MTRHKRPRYTYLSIPGDCERGIPTAWVVFDQHNMRTHENAEDMPDARDKARQLNRSLGA